MNIDPWILAFSALTVVVTIWMGFWSAKRSRSASDFFVAGRGVSVGWNASAISGEYLSAASFMGIAGMVMSSGYDALWYPVCYACGYLFLLLFIAGPLRRFGAYTIPDFAEGRFDSPLFRKIAVIFVLFIGFFYTMPQMKGAGVTLAYIFPGLPYWAGVVLVGAVITFNVALGGMKGITLVQAFQYWLKMFAISVPIFVLMAVYGGYGRQLGANGVRFSDPRSRPEFQERFLAFTNNNRASLREWWPLLKSNASLKDKAEAVADVVFSRAIVDGMETTGIRQAISGYNYAVRDTVWVAHSLTNTWQQNTFTNPAFGRERTLEEYKKDQIDFLSSQGVALVDLPAKQVAFVPKDEVAAYIKLLADLSAPHASGRATLPAKAPPDETWLSPFGPLTTKAAAAAGLEGDAARRLALLYTYSLIIALVCGTAGLPHILVRFYTNPDGVAAKRTTMWVMILIGVFYLFPPVFGVMGRNLIPELYAAIGAKGTDKVVLELPTILGPERGVLGSILSGITCAGAFAAFMSTFSGLLVSMTGALAHDVYGRMLRPRSTPAERMRMFKFCAVFLGFVAVVLGTLVEPLQINFMVGQAFAIAAASYFPLLFMSVWWRGMTMPGAAAGMLAGGVSALAAVTITNFSDLGWLPLKDFWAARPLLRILCEQPAIWTVPLAIGLMIVVSRLTRRRVPADSRMKMLVLHAPEALGLKQEYIREHEGH